MAHRRVRDSEGRDWDVWEVIPTAVERRLSGEAPAVSPEADRRQHHQVRVVVPEELGRGWLAFENGHEKRRLAPIPDGWVTLSDASLLELLARAATYTRRKPAGD